MSPYYFCLLKKYLTIGLCINFIQTGLIVGNKKWGMVSAHFTYRDMINVKKSIEIKQKIVKQ